jgi:hypothetical protein
MFLSTLLPVKTVYVCHTLTLQYTQACCGSDNEREDCVYEFGLQPQGAQICLFCCRIIKVVLLAVNLTYSLKDSSFISCLFKALGNLPRHTHTHTHSVWSKILEALSTYKIINFTSTSMVL